MTKDELNPVEVAARMTTYRKAEGLTQRQLAEMLNTSRGVIGAMELGNIRSRRVAKLALDLVPNGAGDVI
jgi:transcriptional regulator with XRE-family HTH domain